MKIKKIIIDNFRNVDHEEVDCKHLTIWKGKNELGKSNRLNAIVFLLIGKVLTDKYGVGENDIESVLCNKRDDRGRRAECKVQAIFENGQTISRVYKEQWVKKRGSLEAIYEGNVTELYNNDSVINQSEWVDLINQLFEIKECKFKHKDLNIIQAYLDPLYLFQKTDYKVLRALLESLVGDVTMDDIIAAEPTCALAKEEILKYSGDAAKARTGVNKVITDKATGLDSKITQIEAQLEVLPSLPYDEEKYKKLSDEAFNYQLNIKNIKNNPNSAVAELKAKKDAIRAEYDAKADAKIKEITIEKSTIQNDYTTSLSELNAKLLASQKKDLTERKNEPLIKAQSELQILIQQRYELEAQSNNAKATYDSLKNKYTILSSEVEFVKTKIVTLKSELANVAAREPEIQVCPHCGGVLNDQFITDFKNKRSKDVEDIKMNINSYEKQNADNQTKINAITADAQTNADNYRALITKRDNLDVQIKAKESKIENIKLIPFEPKSDLTKELESKLQSLQANYEKKNAELAAARDIALKAINDERTHKLTQIESELQMAEINQATYIEAQVREQEKALEAVNTELEVLIQAKTQNAAREAKIKELERVQYERNEKQALYDAINLYIQTEIKLVNSKCYDATGIKFVMLEDQFNGGLKEVCYPVYTDGNLEIPFSNCSTSRKLIIGCQMIHSLKTLIGSNDLPVMADRCEALDDEHLKMLGKEQMFITQVSNDEKIITIQED